MTGFSAEWLALREPYDLAARDAAWPSFAAPCHGLRERVSRNGQALISVIDLAGGSGNMRAVAPRIGGWQHWQLLDHDGALLAEVPNAMARWALARGYRCRTTGTGPDAVLCIDGPALRIELVCHCVDLSRDPGTIAFGEAHLVTASALLDLVSAPWVDALLKRLCGSGAAWWWALSVDGRIDWDPLDADDATVHRLFDQHQRRDKGFGPALGPDAVPYLRLCAEAAGDAVLQARSDWVVDGAHGAADASAMLHAMIAGMADAAIEQAPAAADIVRAWQARRLAMAKRSRLTVGHLDIALFP